MKRILLLLPLLVVAGALVWFARERNRPPEVEFVRVTRETIKDNLTTNGKIEPVEWAAAHAESGGAVARVLVRKGDSVRAGDALVQLEAREAGAALESAQARAQQAQAELETIEKGGRSAELATIDGSILTTRQQVDAARKEVGELERLVAKNAATAFELTQARDRLAQAEAQIQSLERRRKSLVSAADRTGAEARLRDAQSAAKLATQQIALATVRAPVAGTLYQFTLKPGDFLRPGDEVARIGRIDDVRAVIYVDEPELGRAGIGKPVIITWDAKPGVEWKGSVERMPTQIVPLGQRQVGEVHCRVDNPNRDLIPGANINAVIRASVVANALSVPKSALRRENGEPGVYVLNGDVVAWKPVKLGASSLVKTQVLDGLKEGEAVALPTEAPLKDGFRVTPLIQ